MFHCQRSIPANATAQLTSANQSRCSVVGKLTCKPNQTARSKITPTRAALLKKIPSRKIVCCVPSKIPASAIGSHQRKIDSVQTFSTRESNGRVCSEASSLSEGVEHGASSPATEKYCGQTLPPTNPSTPALTTIKGNGTRKK